MAKKLVIKDCRVCPFMEHHGGFGSIAYIPKCRKAQKDLEYTTASSPNRVVATVVSRIPDWCPLEDDVEVSGSPVEIKIHLSPRITRYCEVTNDVPNREICEHTVMDNKAFDGFTRCRRYSKRLELKDGFRVCCNECDTPIWNKYNE